METMKSMRKETVVAWPKFDDQEIELIRKIYTVNWGRMDIGYMIKNPYSGYAYAFQTLTLVACNSCEELCSDWHLYEELNSEIVNYLGKIEEGSEEYVRVRKLWSDLMKVKSMNVDGRIVKEDI